MINNKLIEKLKYNQINVSEEELLKIESYIKLLQKWNKVHNLISCSDLDEIIDKHIIDSLSVVPYIKSYLNKNSITKNIIDVGAGAGLPGIILAISLPDVPVTMIDSNIKKVAFIHQAITELKIKNAKAINERVEFLEKKQDFQNNFSIIVSRAFSSIVNFIELTKGLLNPNGCWAAMKGKYPTEELNDLSEFKNISLEEAIKINVKSLNAERHLIILKK